MFANDATSVTNDGSIVSANNIAIDLRAGGSVANAGVSSAAGFGIAVYGAAGTVTNSGTISGGVGVFTSGTSGAIANYGTISGTRNDGVVLGAGGTVTNAAGATIFGGSNGVYAKTGAAGSVTNSGNISGGDAGIDLAQGGSVINRAAGSISGASFGVFANDATSVTNDGSIVSANNIAIDLRAGGSVANAGVSSAAGFGIAVYGAAGTVTNSGTISGGVNALRFFGAGGNRLVVQPTAVFIGSVAAETGPSANTLELAGGTGTISGLLAGAGTVMETGHSWSFSGFSALTFGAGAELDYERRQLRRCHFQRRHDAGHGGHLPLPVGSAPPTLDSSTLARGARSRLQQCSDRRRSGSSDPAAW